MIVSSLPWSAFSGELQNELLEAIQRSLAEGGKFVTPIYLWSYPFLTSWKFRRRLRKIFPEVRSVRTVWKNLPPTFVYVAEKTKNTR